MWVLLVIVLGLVGEEPNKFTAVQEVHPYKAFTSEKECNKHAKIILDKAVAEKNLDVNAGCVKLEGITYT